MNPLQRILDQLQNVKRSGKGWVACCPAHEDRTPSLSINECSDGTVLVKCHAGCDTTSILTALSMKVVDLFAAKSGRPRTITTAKPIQTFSSLMEAVEILERSKGKSSGLWIYRDVEGEPTGAVVRWDTRKGKVIRPVALIEGSWRLEAMPCPRPVYRLPEVCKSDQVIICEGEKCADAANALGFVATTSAGGSNAARMTDWKPLAGKQVWIFPDNDSAGRAYAQTVANLCRTAGSQEIRLVELPSLPPKGDIVDWIAAHGADATPDSLREQLEAFGRAATTWNPSMIASSSNKSKSCARPVIVTMSQVMPQTVRWLWPGRIPLGCVSLLIGRPGAGKSFLTCEMAATISRGAEWPAGTGRAPLGDILLICAEDDPGYTIRPRLDACGADPARVHMLTGVSITTQDQEKIVAFTLTNVDIVREALEQNPNVKLIVIDPIGSYLGGGVDAHRDNEVRSVLSPLAEIASEFGVAVLLVCHTRKAEAIHADDTVLGSRAFTGLARSVIHLNHDKEDRNRKLLLAGKCNLGPPAPGLAFTIAGSPARLHWEADPIPDYDADDALDHNTKSSRGPEPESRRTAEAWLLAQLHDGPLLATEVTQRATESGISERTLRRAADQLGIRSQKTSEGPWIWCLPSEDMRDSTG